jgi:hypothetical protein
MATYLTTKDNPYNPSKESEKWLIFDLLSGYNCNGLVARFAKLSENLTDYENDKEWERAIDEIIKNDPLNIYMKYKDDEY